MSLISSLPPEVLLEIFSHFDIIFPIILHDLQNVRLTCRRWNEICEASPTLWTSVYLYVEFDEDAALYPLWSNVTLRVWLKRSKDALLTVQLSLLNAFDVDEEDRRITYTDLEYYFRDIAATAYRWQTCIFKLGDITLRRLVSPMESLPQLEMLLLESSDSPCLTEAATEEDLKGIYLPKLRHLEIRDNLLTAVPMFCSERLVEMVIERVTMSWADYGSLSRSTPNVTNLTLSYISWGRVPTMISPLLETFHHRRVTFLDWASQLHGSDMLILLALQRVAPHIRKMRLDLRSGYQHVFVTPPTILDSAHLEDLELVLPKRGHGDRICGTFERVPSLRTISLSADHGRSPPDLSMFIGRLLSDWRDETLKHLERLRLASLNMDKQTTLSILRAIPLQLRIGVAKEPALMIHLGDDVHIVTGSLYTLLPAAGSITLEKFLGLVESEAWDSTLLRFSTRGRASTV